jgi:hypothetical protein
MIEVRLRYVKGVLSVSNIVTHSNWTKQVGSSRNISYLCPTRIPAGTLTILAGGFVVFLISPG